LAKKAVGSMQKSKLAKKAVGSIQSKLAIKQLAVCKKASLYGILGQLKEHSIIKGVKAMAYVLIISLLSYFKTAAESILQLNA
jgi:uncharacterized protein YjgD (DUF1641 family)